MKKTTARAISFLVLLLTGVPAAAQGDRNVLDEGTLEKGAPPRIFAPGPRWTGRWIVHVERDGAQHRAVIKEIGVLRRARDQAALDARIADYRSMMELLQAPVVELVLDHGAVVL
ncbi:MAG: hypothetical protein O7B99_01570, partial [Planctomycetota bacterium]|nr:hypothetical protein [Planctomycetota bacterium]